MYITPDEWAKMDMAIQAECKGFDPKTIGVSVVLWRLQSLMAGYKYALDHGYGIDERETNP